MIESYWPITWTDWYDDPLALQKLRRAFVDEFSPRCWTIADSLSYHELTATHATHVRHLLDVKQEMSETGLRDKVLSDYAFEVPAFDQIRE